MAVGENPLPKKEEYHEDLTLPNLNFINRFTQKTEDKEEKRISTKNLWKIFVKFFLMKIPEKRLRKTVQSLCIFYAS